MAKVLVVDDHPDNRALITTLLQHAGHSSIEAADGHLALEQVRAANPDLIICDLLMPTMDGYEFVRQLRADPRLKQPEVIFYTATFMEGEARGLAAACGVTRVLIKPCEPQEILDTVAAALSHADPPAAPIDAERFDRDHLRLLTDKLALKVGELERANHRLSALTDLNLQLASERDPYQLLDKVCRGARELLAARYAILCVQYRNGVHTHHLACAGLTQVQVDALGELPTDCATLPNRVMDQGQPERFTNPPGDPAAVGLPPNFPPLVCGLMVPIQSLHRRYGWLLLADKLGADSFTDEDAHLLGIHAAQAGRIYENGSLYKQIRQAADLLEAEVEERKRAARLLHEANESLEHRVRQRTAELRDVIEGLESFNRNVSHDLRGPLGGIAGAARLARKLVDTDDRARAAQFLDLIAQQADTTTRLVEALLSLARISEARIDRLPVDMAALVKEVVANLTPAGSDRPAQVRIAPLPTIDADPVLVRQVLTNLIANALKCSAHRPQPEVEVGVDDGRADTPVFFVRDNGVGFDATQAQRLFKPFSRLHGTRFEGTGVGLSIVKRIVDHHGGRVWAEAEPDRGACFYVSFS